MTGRFLLFFTTMFVCNLASAACLDISGNYATSTGGISGKAWYEFDQVQCLQIQVIKNWDFGDGTGGWRRAEPKMIADGSEHQTVGGYSYKYEMLPDRHILTMRENATGKVKISTRTIDSDGNLVLDSSDGSHEVLPRNSIK